MRIFRKDLYIWFSYMDSLEIKKVYIYKINEDEELIYDEKPQNIKIQYDHEFLQNEIITIYNKIIDLTKEIKDIINYLN